MAAATLIYVFIPRGIDFEADPPRPDFAGIGFLVAGVTAFQIIASRGEQDDWFGSLHLRAAFVIGVVALTAFTLRDIDLKNPHPFLNLRLIVTQRTLLAGLGIAVVFGAMLSGGLYVLPQYLRTIQTYNAAQTGLFYFVDGLASLVGYYLMMKLSPHFGLLLSNFAALILFIIGNCGFVHMLTGDTPAATICIFLVLHGVSTGIHRNVDTGHRYAHSPCDRSTIYFFRRRHLLVLPEPWCIDRCVRCFGVARYPSNTAFEPAARHCKPT
jgi:hypothetical protein